MKGSPKKSTVNAGKPPVSSKGNGPAAKMVKVKTGMAKKSKGC